MNNLPLMSLVNVMIINTCFQLKKKVNQAQSICVTKH